MSTFIFIGPEVYLVSVFCFYFYPFLGWAQSASRPKPAETMMVT